MNTFLLQELQLVLNGTAEMEAKKGIIFEQFFISLLIRISKDVNGAPITTNEIFAPFKGTWLDKYTLKIKTGDFCAPKELYKVRQY